jgi:hypothetical protein
LKSLQPTCAAAASGEKALREAAFAVFEFAPDDQTQDWVAQVTGRWWPGLWTFEFDQWQHGLFSPDKGDGPRVI